MRTTIELPDEVNHLVETLARDTSRTVEDTIVHLLRGGLALAGHPTVTVSERTGPPVVYLGGKITVEDVKAPEDDE